MNKYLVTVRYAAGPLTLLRDGPIYVDTTEGTMLTLNPAAKAGEPHVETYYLAKQAGQPCAEIELESMQVWP